MVYRILSCNTFVENYYICLSKKTIGFSTKIGDIGDIVFLAVKTKQGTMCGAKAIISKQTSSNPWKNQDKYIKCFKINNIEYCNPFNLNILRQFSEKGWGTKFILGSNPIKQKEAIKLLNNAFSRNKCESLYIFSENELKGNKKNKLSKSPTKDQKEQRKLLRSNSIPKQLNIMGTFQTISFLNEQDEIRGLETLVTKHFYNLFTKHTVKNSLLISDNRKFSTMTIKGNNNININGISGIPDALLITYNKENPIPLQINLIEYECYGEQKSSIRAKTEYLNCHIIPQLMRFASTFSVVTDYKIRENTIKSWVGKISNYIYNNNELTKRTSNWIKELYPKINEMQIALRLNELLKHAFENSLNIILIIDELTSEQKNTIENIIGSFKLNNSSKNNSIGFTSYIVRLEQKVNIIDNNNVQYALSYQE